MDRHPNTEQFLASVNVSRETIDRLSAYEAELKKWNQTINLVSAQTLDNIWSRHFLDSAQIWKFKPKNTSTWLDLGSGAGFPGLVIAIIAKEQSPGIKVGLVESDQRKASFLLHTSQQLGVAVDIHNVRAEKLEPQNADVISVRALAPVIQLLAHSERHLAKNGLNIFLKGKNADKELTGARKYWKFDLQKTASETDSGGVILRIRKIERV